GRGQAGPRVDPQEAAGLAEVPEGLRCVAAAGPVRRLRAADLEAQAPVVGVLAPEAGQHAGQARQLDGGGLGEELGVQDLRGEEPSSTTVLRPSGRSTVSSSQSAKSVPVASATWSATSSMPRLL